MKMMRDERNRFVVFAVTAGFKKAKKPPVFLDWQAI